jgi:hypothetical protein
VFLVAGNHSGRIRHWTVFWIWHNCLSFSSLINTTTLSHEPNLVGRTYSRKV